MPIATKILKKGSKGQEVKLLQQLLNRNLLINELPNGRRLGEDSDFGSKTDLAVRAFQRKKRLGVDGDVGSNTWKALGVQFAGPATPRSTGSAAGSPSGRGGIDEERAAPWMATARAEMAKNVREIPGQAAHPDIVKYFTACPKWTSDDAARASRIEKRKQSDESAWCSAFVNWVLMQRGITGTQTGWAITWERWGTKLLEPRFGAVTTIYRNGGSMRHVAFMVGADRNNVYLLGGNQGDRIKIKPYAKSRQREYLWPTSRI